MDSKPVAPGRLDLPRVVLPACLFISGASALAFEVVWAKYLVDLVGSTAVAHTVVLCTFMGGLAAGAWLFGRWADRTKRPLVLYGVLELGVAITCLLFPLVFLLAGSVYVQMAAPLAESTFALTILRAGLAVATIVIPSILMGGTLPAATRFYVRSISEVGSGVARLYFINALGAVLGCILAGFTLMPLIGLNGTLYAAASLNVIAGVAGLLLALLLVRRGRSGALGAASTASPAEPSATAAESEVDPDETSPFPRWVAGVALASIAICGAASMVYEIVWIRILTLVMGGSTYAFTTMLAAFILGIALGSALVSWRKTRLSRSGLGGFGWLQVSIAAVTILSVPLYNRLPFYYQRMARLLGPEVENYPAFLGAGFLV
ncbi:MAG: fused MFS/spermidine synthase, partial [Myxococcota bacterium]